jgi:hypothetical protein
MVLEKVLGSIALGVRWPCLGSSVGAASAPCVKKEECGDKSRAA